MNKTNVILFADYGSDDPRTAEWVGCVKQADPLLDVYPAHIWIPRHDVNRAGSFLYTTLPFWPAGTVFTCTVRRASDAPDIPWIAVCMENGCIALLPDNGTITMVMQNLGIAELRRLNGVRSDLEAAKSAGLLASGQQTFAQAGPLLDASEVKQFTWPAAKIAPGLAEGVVALVMQNFGNLITNIPIEAFEKTGMRNGDTVRLTITRGTECMYCEKALLHSSFGFAGDGEPVVFNGSNGFMDFGLNRRNFVKSYLPALQDPEEDVSAYSVRIEKECGVAAQ